MRRVRLPSATALIAVLAALLPLAWPRAGAAETFVLVHGAYMTGAAWRPVVPLLERAGHEVVVVELPGRPTNPAPGSLASLDGLRDAVLRAIGNRRDVILVGHSFGGMAISAAAEAAPERVRRLIYVAAFLPRSGESSRSLGARDPAGRLRQDDAVLADNSAFILTVRPTVAAEAFCDRRCTPAQRMTLAEGLVPEPFLPFRDTVTLTPGRFGRVPRSYIMTLQDPVITPAFQQEMLAATPVEELARLDTGHAPFLTAPEDVAEALLRLGR